MKISFLYDGLHPAHATWAKSVGAEFVSDRTWSFIPNIARLIKSFTVQRTLPKDTDILLCEGGSELLAGALWKKKHPDGKLVLIVDDPKLLFIPKMSYLKRKMYLWALPFYDLFIPTSNFMALSVPPDLPGASKVVPLFVKDKYRNRGPSGPGKRNIIFVGRVGRLKGVDRIVDAFNLVKKDFPESSLYIVGDGPLKKGLEKENKNIHCTGQVKDPEEYFLKGSIYMNLSRVEPFGIAILEAMCLGLVPIVTEKVGVADFIKEASPELVVQNATEAGQIVKKLWNSPKLLEEYSGKSRKIALEFSEENSVTKFKEAMGRVMNGAAS
jgi:glycosyltransferase involved in cell wall biosynthesis